MGARGKIARLRGTWLSEATDTESQKLQVCKSPTQLHKTATLAPPEHSNTKDTNRHFDLKAQSNQSCVRPYRLTLVQICERLVMQLDSGRCGSTQHILEWGVFGLVFRRKTGFLLLKDWQSQHVAERDQRGQKTDKSTRRKHKNLY